MGVKGTEQTRLTTNTWGTRLHEEKGQERIYRRDRGDRRETETIYPAKALRRKVQMKENEIGIPMNSGTIPELAGFRLRLKTGSKARRSRRKEINHRYLRHRFLGFSEIPKAQVDADFLYRQGEPR